MLKYECFDEDVYKEAAQEFLILNKDKFNIKNAANEHVMFIASKSFVKKVYQGSLISLRRGGFVIKGRIRSDKNCFSLIRPTKKKLESIDDALLLIFPSHFSGILRNNRNVSDAFAEYYIKNARKRNEIKEFILFKTLNRRTSKIYKKIKRIVTKKSSFSSLDKMFDV